MYRRNIAVIIIFSLVFASSAKAAEWELFAENSDQQYYVDTKSIEHAEITCSWCSRCSLNSVEQCVRNLPQNFMRVWTKKKYKHPARYQETEEMDFQEYACEKGMSRLLHATRIYADGTSDSVNLNVVITWEAIASDAMSELVHAYLCKGE